MIDNKKILGQIDLPKLDVTKHIGKKVMIEKIEEHSNILKGRKQYYVSFSTIPLEVLQKSDGTKIEICARKNIGLQEVSEGLGWGKGTKMDKFLQRYNLKHYNDAKGVEVIVQIKAGENTDFLTFE